jgi:hypothetical protein
MRYASASIVINLSKQKAWDLLVEVIENLDKHSDEINKVQSLESYYDGFLREVHLTTAEKYYERIFILKDQSKIVARLNEHPIYQGETIFQIVAPDDIFLSDKKVTLIAVLSWRIHPGLIEAPLIYKDNFIEQLVINIGQAANTSILI